MIEGSLCGEVCWSMARSQLDGFGLERLIIISSFLLIGIDLRCLKMFLES